VITFIKRRGGLHWSAMAIMVFVFFAQLGDAHAAEDKKAKAQQERITKLQQAQQALEQEKGQLQAEKADAEKVAKSAKGELDRLRAQTRKEAAQVQTLQAQSDALTAKLAQSEQALAQEREKLQALQLTYNQFQNQTRTSLRNTEQQLAERNTALNTCEANNAGLYKLNTDLLGLYEKASASSGLLGLAGFAQRSRVKLENEVTVYADKLDDLKVTPAKTQ
jgi:chromosome segregation ATPase